MWLKTVIYKKFVFYASPCVTLKKVCRLYVTKEVFALKESTIERRLTNGVKNTGGLALKFVSPGHAGVPDRIVLLPGGKLMFVELKTETGNLTPLQINTQNRLRLLGFDVRTLYGKQYVDRFLEEIRDGVSALPLSKSSS